MKDWTKFLVIVIIAVGVLIRLRDVASLPVEYQSWRQTDTAALARNYAEEGYRLFYPTIDWRGRTAGYIESELSIYAYIVALLYGVLGEHEIIARLVTIAAWAIAAWLLFLIGRRAFGRRAGVFALAFFAFLSPFSIFLGRVIMGDLPAQTLVILSIYAALRWQEHAEAKWFVVSMAAAAAAALSKLPMLYVGLPLAAIIIQREGIRALVRPRNWIGAIAVLGVVGGWYWHAHQIGLQTGLNLGFIAKNSLFTKNAPDTNQWISDWAFLSDPGVYQGFLYNFTWRLLTPFGLILTALGLALPRWDRGTGPKYAQAQQGTVESQNLGSGTMPLLQAPSPRLREGGKRDLESGKWRSHFPLSKPQSPRSPPGSASVPEAEDPQSGAEGAKRSGRAGGEGATAVFTWLLSVVIYFLIAAPTVLWSDYYTIALLPIAALYIGKGADFIAGLMAEWMRHPRPVFKLGALGLAVVVAAGLVNSTSVTIASANDLFAPRDPIVQAVQAGQWIQAVVPKNVRIITVGGEEPTGLYFAHRYGLWYGGEGQDYRIFDLDKLAKQKWKYLIVYNPYWSAVNKPWLLLLHTGWKLIGGSSWFLAYDISQKQPVTPQQAFTPAPQWANQISLLGYDLTPAAPVNGKLYLVLYWRKDGQIPGTYTGFLHVLDSRGNVCGQDDHIPLNGLYTQDMWKKGETFLDPFELDVSNCSLGGLTLEAGLYTPESGERLQSTGQGNPNQTYRFEIQIQK